MERLTSEQIRLLEEIRELRDSGILTVDEFEVQVAKVLGRPLVVEPLPVDEELSAPEDTPVAELLEYEFVEPGTPDEDEIPVEENQVVESSSTSDIPAEKIAEAETQQNNSSRRKILVGTTVGLILIVAIALVALGGGKRDSTSSQVIDSASTVTQSTIEVTTQAPTTSTTTTTEVIPTTTYEVLECPYTRVIETVEGKIVSPEGISMKLRPATYFLRFRDDYANFREEDGRQAGVEVTNTTNFRLRIGMQLEWAWPNGSLKVQWGPGRGGDWWKDGFETSVGRVPDVVVDSKVPITDIQLRIINATIEYRCP